MLFVRVSSDPVHREVHPPVPDPGHAAADAVPVGDLLCLRGEDRRRLSRGELLDVVVIAIEWCCVVIN